MTDLGQSGGLRIIFSFFLGLMLTTLIGVGVYTFHPPPDQLHDQIREFKRQEQAIRNSKPDNELTAADRDQIQAIVRQRNELDDAAEQARKEWALRTSIILIVLATFAMAISLVRADRVPVISNGLLLGGVFAMLYGVGWIATSGSSVVRFLVMAAAFVITLGLGYARFVHRGKVARTEAPLEVPEGGLADIDRRIRDLEQRLEKAAQELARGQDS